MSKNKPSQALPVERVQNSYRQLCLAAADLNAVTDELGKAISVWDAALKKLNLGISAWVDISSGESGSLWCVRDVGYTKLNDKWGISLREREGDQEAPEQDSEKVWPFCEAPRWMRIEGAGRLPDLIDALLRQVQETTDRIKGRTAQAYELARAIDAPAPLPDLAFDARELSDGVATGIAESTALSLAAQITENLLNASPKQQGKR